MQQLSDSRQASERVLDQIFHGLDYLMDTDAERQVTHDLRRLLWTKGKDYSSLTTYHTWASFEWAASSLGLPVESVFGALIGTKLSRLHSLQDHAPYHESLRDSWYDLICYLILWEGYLTWRRELARPPLELSLSDLKALHPTLPDVLKRLQVGHRPQQSWVLPATLVSTTVGRTTAIVLLHELIAHVAKLNEGSSK